MKRLLTDSLIVFALLPCIAGCGSNSDFKNSPTPSVSLKGAVAATSNPLVASYTVTSSLPGYVTIDFGPDTTYGLTTSTQILPAAGDSIVILVAGMKAASTYHMRATVQYLAGFSKMDTDHTFVTGSLPAGLVPSYTVSTTSGLTPQPGVELVDSLTGSQPTQSIAFATDLDGNVIWAYPCPDCQVSSLVDPIKLLPDGNFMAIIAPNSSNPLTSPITPSALNVLREFDLAGNVVRQLTMADLNASLAAQGFDLTLQVFSHDFAVLPNGHILVLTNTLKAFTNLVGYPGTTNVLGDVVVDLDPNFNPVWIWNEFDHFDVNRHPMGFPDWTHSNALIYSADDNNFLVSIRHQNWIVKVDYRGGGGTGAVLWKLGEGGDFTLQGGVDPTDWFYAQHDANFASANTTGVFQLAAMDNGDDREFPADVTCNASGAPPCLYSTIPVMQIDENAKTASFLFHQVQPANLYSSFAGSTRVQPNANIEYNLAGVGTEAYTFEVTPGLTPQVVWQMHLLKSNTYRSFRIPSLYPGVAW
jgi:arylsulfate sulfotransferase